MHFRPLISLTSLIVFWYFCHLLFLSLPTSYLWVYSRILPSAYLSKNVVLSLVPVTSNISTCVLTNPKSISLGHNFFQSNKLFLIFNCLILIFNFQQFSILHWTLFSRCPTNNSISTCPKYNFHVYPSKAIPLQTYSSSCVPYFSQWKQLFHYLFKPEIWMISLSVPSLLPHISKQFLSHFGTISFKNSYLFSHLYHIATLLH